MYNYNPPLSVSIDCPVCLNNIYKKDHFINKSAICLKCKATIEMSMISGEITKVKIQISDKLIILYLSSCNTIQIWKFKDNDFYLHKRINYTSQSQFSQLIQSYQIFS